MNSKTVEQSCTLRVGYVSVYNPKRHMARVRFPDKGNLVSDWLPVLIGNCKKNFDERHLDVDEHVACMMFGNGLEAGVVVGALWDDLNKPHTGDQDVRCTEFEDGTRVSYDRKNHVLDVNVKGDINIIATGHVLIRGARIDLNP